MTVTHVVRSVFNAPLYVHYMIAGVCAFVLIWSAFHFSAKVRADSEARNNFSLAAFQFVKRSLMAKFPGRIGADGVVVTDVRQSGSEKIWVVTGTVMTETYGALQPTAAAFNAKVSATCDYLAQDVCWRLLELNVAEQSEAFNGDIAGRRVNMEKHGSNGQLLSTAAVLKGTDNQALRTTLRYDLAFLRSEQGLDGVAQHAEAQDQPSDRSGIMPPIPKQKPATIVQ